MDVRVIRARAEEHELGRRLLPSAFADGQPLPVLYLAVANNCLCGGAAVAAAPDISQESALRCQLAVLPQQTFDEYELARALTAQLRSVAGDSRADALYSYRLSEMDRACQLMCRLGFRPSTWIREFEVSVERAAARLLPIARRSRRRAAAGLRVAPYTAVPRSESGQLHIDTFGFVPPEHIAACDPELMPGRDFTPSRAAVTAAGDIAGTLLGSVRGDTAQVYTRIVAPEHRRGPASLLMMAAFVESLDHSRVDKIRFDCASDNRDTLRLAEQLGAASLPGKVILRAPLH